MKDSVEQERFVEMQELYTDCLEKKVNILYASDIQFLFKSGIISIFTDRCSAHYNMTLDELWTFRYNYDTRSAKDYLTPLGLKLSGL